MSRVHRNAREARVQCIDCNKPVVRTVDGEFVCIECGESPIDVRTGDAGDVVVQRGLSAKGGEGVDLPARSDD